MSAQPGLGVWGRERVLVTAEGCVLPCLLGCAGKAAVPVTKNGEWALEAWAAWVLVLTDPRAELRPGRGKGS